MKYSAYILLISLLFYSCSSSDDEIPCKEITWYADTDSDGFGDVNNTIQSCTKPEGYIDNDTDCNDADNTVHPNALEVHNNIDDNCDGIVDECSSDSDCNGVCVDGICMEEVLPPFSYEFTKYQYTHTYNANNTVIPYNFFEPAQSITSNENFPLIVSLHGTEYHLVSEEDFLAHFPSNYMANAWIEEAKQQNFPAYVVAPNLHEGLWDTEYRSWQNSTSQDFLNQLIDSLINNNQIDPNRIYFVGHSIGGGAVWKLSQTLKNRAAAIISLSHALGATENANPIIDDISNGVYDDISIWAIVHVSDVEGSIRTSRPIFEYLQDNNYNPAITNTLGDQVYALTAAQIEAEIDAGKSYFYTENRGTPCEHGGGCHYSWVTQLEEELIYKWLFKQQKND